MRTDDPPISLGLPVEFRTQAIIELWERDRIRSDAIGTNTVDRSLRGRGPQTVTLSRDSGIAGDATYRLCYLVE